MHVMTPRLHEPLTSPEAESKSLTLVLLVVLWMLEKRKSVSVLECSMAATVNKTLKLLRWARQIRLAVL